MKKLAIAVVFLAIAGVILAQDAPKADKPEAAAPVSGEVKVAPAAAEGEFCAREKTVEGKATLGKCHKKSCKFFPKKDVKCFSSADAAKTAGVTSFCKICCPELQ